MSTEQTQHKPQRFKLALKSLEEDVTLAELAASLVKACEEVCEEEVEPLSDAAVSIIAARIGFASPASVVGKDSWEALIDLCMRESPSKIELRKEQLN